MILFFLCVVNFYYIYKFNLTFLAIDQDKSDNSEFDKSYSEKDECIEIEKAIEDEPPEILNLDKIIEEFKTSKEYKFIYLIYAVSKKSKYFSPYNFKIVTFKNINKNCFFTLSNEGMMSHIRNEVKFTPFAKFEEEYRSYQKIIKVS